MLNTSETSVATGIIKLNNKLIIILDFEKIVTDISPETGLKVSDIKMLGERQRFLWQHSFHLYSGLLLAL